MHHQATPRAMCAGAHRHRHLCRNPRGHASVDLGAAVIRDVLARAGLDASDLRSVFMGQVVQAGTKMNPARQAAIQAGVPVGVPAMTVDRVCGSGARRSSARRTRSCPGW